MHLQIDKKKKILLYLFLLFFLGSINNISLNKFNILNLNVTHINVTGLENEENQEISEQLLKYIPDNIFFINKKYFTDFLNKHSLIQSFSIQKNYPNSIDIKIIKTKFLALTNRNGKIFIIGSNGKIIKNKSGNISLPYVFGDVKIKQFLQFIEIIDKSKIDKNKIETFYFFQSARWDIKTKTGLLIKLPKDNLYEVLNYLFTIIDNDEFSKVKTIDLRIGDQLITSND